MLLTDPQLRFIRLHQRHFVESWQAIFCGAMIRARTDRGVTVTVTADECGLLVDLGLMAPGWGGSLMLTEQGKALA